MFEFADILLVLIPVLYGLTAVNSVVLFVWDPPLGRALNRPLLGTTVGMHLLGLVIDGVATKMCPLTTVFQAMGVMAFALVSVYFFVSLRRGRRPTGMLILPIAFLLEVLAASVPPAPGKMGSAFASPWFTLHALSAVLGIAALTVSFADGVLYLLLYRGIKAQKFGLLFRRLPPLATLNRMTLTTAVVGFGLLTVAIGAGFGWSAAQGTLPRLWVDPMFLVTTAAWALYAIGLSVRFLAGWRGRYTVYLSVCGFVFLIVAMVCVSFFLPSLHEFR